MPNPAVPNPVVPSPAVPDPAVPDPAVPGSAPSEPALSYEAARAELQQVLAALESGGEPLEDSLTLWRRGEDLADICQRWLDDATQRLDDAIAVRGERPEAGT